jgi:predicted MFS family arabinose efflux permease
MGLGGLAIEAPLGGLLARTFGLTAPFWAGAFLLGATALMALPVVNNRTIAEARERSNSPE